MTALAGPSGLGEVGVEDGGCERAYGTSVIDITLVYDCESVVVM